MHKSVCGLLAVVSLAGCLASGLLFFLGYFEAEAYRKTLAAASLAWFIFATAWSRRKTKPLKGQG